MKLQNIGYIKSIFKFLKCSVTNSQNIIMVSISLPHGWSDFSHTLLCKHLPFTRDIRLSVKFCHWSLKGWILKKKIMWFNLKFIHKGCACKLGICLTIRLKSLNCTATICVILSRQQRCFPPCTILQLLDYRNVFIAQPITNMRYYVQSK